MSFISQLITVADAFCDARRLSRRRVSTLVFNDGKRLTRLADEGRDLHTGSFEHAMRWFSSNWPEGVAWPSDVPRPARDGSLVRPWPPLPVSEEVAA